MERHNRYAVHLNDFINGGSFVPDEHGRWLSSGGGMMTLINYYRRSKSC